jgi:hypothetical protein
MPYTEAQLNIQAPSEAQARLDTARDMIEIHKDRLASLPRNADKGDEAAINQAIADATAFVAARQGELPSNLALMRLLRMHSHDRQDL